MKGAKLHLGCGKRYLKGYIHVDLSDSSHIDYKSNIRLLPMFENESAELIYASHVLEYFDRFEVIDVLAEWKRILIPSGILRLSVPDFFAIADIYMESRDLQKIIGPIYGRWQIEGSNAVAYHKTTYDQDNLCNLLIETGFIGPSLWDWRKVFVDELEGFDDYSRAYIPHMDFESGRLISLNVEARKPAF